MSVDPQNRTAETAPPPGANVFHDILLTYIDPVRVFFNLPRVNRSTSALFILLVVQGLIGWAIVQTGVYRYETLRQAERTAFAHVKAHEADDDPTIAQETADGMIKTAEFMVVLYGIIQVLGKPLVTLASVGLIAGFLFVAVALSGGKPKMALLTGIVAFASLVQIPQDAVRLYLTGQTKHSRVEVSAAAFPGSLGGAGGVSIGKYILLRRLNPFDLWFWCLVHLGARKGARMTVRGATISVVVMVLFDMMLQSGLDYGELAIQPPPEQQG